MESRKALFARFDAIDGAKVEIVQDAFNDFAKAKVEATVNELKEEERWYRVAPRLRGQPIPRKGLMQQGCLLGQFAWRIRRFERCPRFPAI
jgi:hypothetical protein